MASRSSDDEEDDDQDYIAFRVTADERERLAALARLNERDISQEVRWRLRRLLRVTPGQSAEPAA